MVSISLLPRLPLCAQGQFFVRTCRGRLETGLHVGVHGIFSNRFHHLKSVEFQAETLQERTLRSSAVMESSLAVISLGRLSSSPTASLRFILAPISLLQTLRSLFQLSVWKRTMDRMESLCQRFVSLMHDGPEVEHMHGHWCCIYLD